MLARGTRACAAVFSVAVIAALLLAGHAHADEKVSPNLP